MAHHGTGIEVEIGAVRLGPGLELIAAGKVVRAFSASIELKVRVGEPCSVPDRFKIRLPAICIVCARVKDAALGGQALQ
ncbi:hypothetical protein [Mesorhizobium sp. NFR06]|uniref:hypothetical protein n=1 Tax=Mesorhizobium sp. NFR06 TaxID=1566290 RepID=UPI00122D6390|nr:hypothetical protein [Mesorhizobium sp. NFR06]